MYQTPDTEAILTHALSAMAQEQIYRQANVFL